MKSVSVRTWALINLTKQAALNYTDGAHGPGNQPQVIGKTVPGTITTQLRKGQKSPATKHSDVPIELRKKLRRKHSSDLARAMHKAGGPTAPEADAYTAVLEERGVNPNLAEHNLALAKQAPNDMYFLRNKK